MHLHVSSSLSGVEQQSEGGGGGVEPRQSCPFLKLESHFTLSIHIPAGNRFIQGPVWCWDDLNIVEFCLPQQD